MILDVQKVSKAYGTDVILNAVSFHIEEHEKAAIVGHNGAGKSTLLKIITEELEADSGQVTLQKGSSVGYLAQHISLNDEKTIYEEVLSACGHLIRMQERLRDMEEQMGLLSGEVLDTLMEAYHTLSDTFERSGGLTYRSEITGVLKGLGFAEEEFTKRISACSGGQKTRVELARLLILKPDLLLLDEPTNHLDIEAVTWLEGFLQNYKGALIIVAHDRYFLDRIVTKVVDLERGKAHVFQGNYTVYAAQKKKLRQAQENAWKNQQMKIAHQEAVITKLRQFNREKSIKRADSRVKQLEKIEVLERPEEENVKMNLTFAAASKSGKDVLHVEGLAKHFGDLRLFEDLSFDLRRGEKAALIGGNGTGKTTILKLILGMIEADGGIIRLGTGVRTGYFDQEQKNLHPQLTLYDEIAQAYPKLTQTQIRNTLAAFLFTGDDVFKLVSELSGGERGRLEMALLMLSGANFLLLDEPTNHLDMVSKEVLEDVLKAYDGTLLYVSHDRYFINQTADRVLYLGDGTLTQYQGNYDDYLEKRTQLEELRRKAVAEGVLVRRADDAGAGESGSGKDAWQQAKNAQAVRRKKENALRRAEEAVTALEERKDALNVQLADPLIASDAVKLQKISREMEELEEKLGEAYTVWEKAAEEAEA